MSATQLDSIPPLSPSVYGNAATGELPFPLEEPGCRLFARARHGLWQGVQALGLLPGDEVLVPAYHHGSEVEALLAAGLTPRFYAGDSRLEPDAGELEAMLRPAVRALYLTHFLGFPQDAARWRAWCDERGLLLIEDAAQAWLAESHGRPVGSLGDMAIFCLYKSVGVPDGGALLVRAADAGPDGVARVRVPGADSSAPAGLAGTARRHAAWMLQHSGLLADVKRRRRSGRPYDPEEDFALGDPGSAPTAATQRLLRRAVDDTVAARRRAHYAMLAEALGDRVAPPFDRVPPGASPFAFPIEVDTKREVLGQLKDVGAVDFWSVPHPSLPVREFPDAARRRARTVILPVHQELRLRDVERIIRTAGTSGRRRLQPSIERIESLDALKDDWTRLAELSSNVFSSWEWASTWWRHYARGRAHHIFAVRSPEGALVGILPLYVHSRRPHVVRFIGQGPADELGPVCAPADRVVLSRALRRALAELDADFLLAERVPADHGWAALLGGEVVSSDGSPVIELGASSWDALLATWSRGLRKQLGKWERKLEREHRLHYGMTTERDALHEDLESLFRLHAARWPEEQSPFTGVDAAFHRDFARLAFERGWLRLWLMHVDGQPAAAEMVYRFGGVDCSYQSGRDPTWRQPSVGTLLMAHAIKSALEDGAREYRLLRGGEAYKYRFAHRDPGVETVVLPCRPLATGALVARHAVPERWRSALSRRAIR